MIFKGKVVYSHRLVNKEYSSQLISDKLKQLIIIHENPLIEGKEYLVEIIEMTNTYEPADLQGGIHGPVLNDMENPI